MLHTRRLLAGAALISFGVMACSGDNQPAAPSATPSLMSAREAPVPTDDYILILPQDPSVPSTLAAEVSAAGGTVKQVLPEAGLVIATSKAAGFELRASKFKGVQTAVRDQLVQFVDPNQKVVAAEDVVDASGEVTADAHVGVTETFSAAQWAPGAIHAPEAWHAGYRGLGARVAILDGGIQSSHIDIAPNLDAARSRSFATGAYNTDTGTFWHGTHVASIVAAPINNLGITGIAPSATIIGVKVLHGGSGSFEGVINGIVYAAKPIAEGGAGAHIINRSLGAILPKMGNEGTIEVMNRMGLETRIKDEAGDRVLRPEREAAAEGRRANAG